MMNHEITLEGVSLHVADVERSIEFYTRIPGAQLVGHRPGQFARFRIGTGNLHLVQLPGPRFHLELNTEDVQQTYEQMCANGLTPAHPPKRHPWGKTDFRLTDPDGYQLEFGVFEGSTQS